MASAGDQADLLFTQSLLNDANISYLKELAVSDDPQIESVVCVLLRRSLLRKIGEKSHRCAWPENPHQLQTLERCPIIWRPDLDCRRCGERKALVKGLLASRHSRSPGAFIWIQFQCWLGC